MQIILCAGECENLKNATPIGIGLMQTAINLTKICIEKKPSKLLFFGTAGSYGKIKMHDVIQTKSTCNVEIGHLQNLSYTPLKNAIVSRETMQEAVVNSSNFITCDKTQAEFFLNYGCDLENMEFFAIKSVAESFKIKYEGIFYVTNYCDKNAHKDFIKNHNKAKNMLENEIKKRLL